MLTVNQLIKIAEELESPENSSLIAAEEDEELLSRVSTAFVRAADALRCAAEEMEALEPSPGDFTEEKLDQIAILAESFAESDDELLQKQAAMLDDLLVTLGSQKNKFLFSIAKDGDRIAELKKKYNDTREKQLEGNKIKEAVKAVEDSDVYKQYRSNEASLSHRGCPDHAGVPVSRCGENQVKCSLDGKIYDYNEGFTTINGNKVPGGSVQEQGSMDGHHSFMTFDDTRANRMGFNNDQGNK